MLSEYPNAVAGPLKGVQKAVGDLVDICALRCIFLGEILYNMWRVMMLGGYQQGIVRLSSQTSESEFI